MSIRPPPPPLNAPPEHHPASLLSLPATTMFDAFRSPKDFYPGLILWCDLSRYDVASCYRRRSARELRPCLVVDVNLKDGSFEAARFADTLPTDPWNWAKIDNPPVLTWKLNDAYIWISTPLTIPMIFNDSKLMHPNRDAYYSTEPIATANLQSYWVHRQAYLNSYGYPSTPAAASPISPSVTDHRFTNIYQAPRINEKYRFATVEATPMSPTPPYTPPPKYQQQAPTYSNSSSPTTMMRQTARHARRNSAAGSDYSVSSSHSHSSSLSSSSSGSSSAMGAVPPYGFTEAHPDYPGLWRNPTTGSIWHASRGGPALH
ncbi:hypothetical protein R3P38DRAFT_2878833 [Favolaschia claudopus]|uniref:Uncharacterized protein n=1 Tax=Favolaschia claudopus TaxID=2862362 RepID=A0AAW0D1U5_9AGAR